jgi:predicted Zn-dependent peptidase
MRTILTLSLLLLPLLISPRTAAAAPGEPFPIERFSLANGLQVWVQPRDDSQSVAAMLVFRVGARDESRELSGISHFVEHMLFTGSERWGEDEIKTFISQRGGRWNGWTGYEQTTYFAQVAAQDTPLALDWLAEVAFRSTFPPDKIDKEREVIFQEKAGRYGWLINGLDGLGFGYELDRDVRRALYPDSSLGQRIIGEDDSLDRTGRDELLAYYQRYYTPANATLVLVGRSDPAQVRAWAEQYFGALPAGTPAPVPPAPPESPPGPHQVVVRGPLLTDRASLMLGARTVGWSHPDSYALNVLSELLSRQLTETIRYQRGLVYGLWAYNSSFSDTGYFVVSTTASSASEAEIRREIEAAIAAVSAGQLDAARVDEAKAALVGRWALSMEDNVSRADYLADCTMLLGVDQAVPDRAALLMAVTPDDLVRVANRYLTPEASYVGVHRPLLTVAGGAAWGGAIVGVGVLAGAGWYFRRRRR